MTLEYGIILMHRFILSWHSQPRNAENYSIYY